MSDLVNYNQVDVCVTIEIGRRQNNEPDAFQLQNPMNLQSYEFSS